MDIEKGVGKVSTLHFYIFNNGIISKEGMSGSDQRAINWATLFEKKSHNITIVTSDTGAARYKKFNCIIASNILLPGGIGLAVSYLWRGIKTAVSIKKIGGDITDNTVLYSSSDLLPDSIPAIYFRIKNSCAHWITGLHLIAPNPFKGFQKVSTKGYTLPTPSSVYYFLSQRAVLRFMKRYAHTVMVSNSMDKQFLLKKGFSSQKVTVTYGAVDWMSINNTPAQEIEYDACYIGRFHKQKGFPDLLEVWAQVCKKHPTAKLVIVGNDINFHEVVDVTKAKGLADNVIFKGFLNGVDKFTVMKASKICIFPSTYESFGMVAAEAMACQLPVVAYDLPVYDEIYPVGMLRASIGDIDGLVKRVNALLENESYRQKVSHEAFELSQQFTWQKTAEKILGRLN